MDLLKCGNYVKPLKNVHSFQAMGMTKLKNMGQGSFLKYFKSIFFKAVNWTIFNLEFATEFS